jgi:hypothetical protein
MGNLSEGVVAFLTRLARILGIDPSDSQRYEKMKQKLDAAKASNVDKLEALKDKIGQIEKNALRKKKEWVAAKGTTKRIISGELERLFRDMDRLRGEENIIASKLEHNSVAQAKLAQVIAEGGPGPKVTDTDLDDIALDLQEAVEGLEEADRAIRDLEGVEYQPPKVSQVNVGERMAEITGEQETTAGLSTDTEKWLEQLETED